MKNQFTPKIRKSPPGPKARKVLKQDETYIAPCYTRTYPLVIKNAQDLTVEDVDGNRFLDMTAGVAVLSTGHCHPEIVKAIKNQTEKFIHMSGTDFYYSVESELAQALNEITPGAAPKKAFFTNSGAETVEAAFKLARFYTKKPAMLSFLGGFHGRTLGALSLTTSKVIHRKHFIPLVPHVIQAFYPYCYRCIFNLTPDRCGFACLKYIEDVLFKKVVSPAEVAAIIFEPIQGEGGYIVPPDGYFDAFTKLMRRHGILLICDEIQSGMGRTGKMFAIEHFNIVPDIICIAKGIASGMPLGAMVAKSSLHIWESGAHANTFGGNPIACAAALKTIELLKNRLVKNAEITGNLFKDELLKLYRRYEFIGDIRGKGLMLGMEIVTDRTSKTKSPDVRDRIVQDCFMKGLLLLPCGDTSIRFCPSLTIKPEHIHACTEILDNVLRKI